MVDQAFWLVLVQHWAGMDADAEVVLGGFVDFVFVVFGAIHKETWDYALADVGVNVVFVDAELFVVDIDFHAFQQPGELLFDISSSPQRSDLQEVFFAPLLAALVLHPHVVDV